MPGLQPQPPRDRPAMLLSGHSGLSFPDGFQAGIGGQMRLPRKKYNELDVSLVRFDAV